MAKTDKKKAAGKNNKKKKDVSLVAKPIKPKKIHGPTPDYTRKTKVVAEQAQTNPENIWNGWIGNVDIKGMRFRVSKKKSVAGDKEFRVVHVLTAPDGTELCGVGESNIYVTVAQIHLPKFRSSFESTSEMSKIQERIWSFFHGYFVEIGIKKANQQTHVKAITGLPGKIKTIPSSSVNDLIAGVPGVYSFENSTTPAALFRIKTIPYSFHGTKELKQVLVVETLAVDLGHQLCDYVQKWVFIYHNQLLWGKIPNFKGASAGEQHKLWEFLSDLIAEYRKTVVSANKPVVSSANCVVNDKVIYLSDRRVAA